MATCTVLVILSEGARTRECGEPALRLTTASCPCGHSGQDWQCIDHAEVAAAEAFCLACNSEGHYCPLEINAA